MIMIIFGIILLILNNNNDNIIYYIYHKNNIKQNEMIHMIDVNVKFKDSNNSIFIEFNTRKNLCDSRLSAIGHSDDISHKFFLVVGCTLCIFIYM